MLIPYQKLTQQLASDPFLTSYLIMGNEPFLGQKAATQIISTAKEKGYQDRIIFYIGTKVNEQQIYNTLSSNDLFSRNKMIHIRFEQEKLNKKEGEKLAKVLQHKTNHLILVQAETLDYKTQKEKWLQTITKHFLCLQVSKIYPNQLKNWLFQQGKEYQVNLSEPAVDSIIDLSQGNLLWSDQIIRQLKLIYPDQLIDSKEIREILEDSSSFQLSDLSQAILEKNPMIYRILTKLESENISPVLINAIFKKDIEVLLQLSLGQHPEQVMKELKIWQSQQQKYLRAQTKHNTTTLKQSLIKIAKIDKINKGVTKGSAWTAINQLAYTLIYA